MQKCGVCNGLGRVAAGGIAAEFVFNAGAHECGRCHGTGFAGPLGGTVPVQRSGSGVLVAELTGEWLVEMHGSGHLLAVIRFLLSPDRDFTAHGEYGAPLDWQARGRWQALVSGNRVLFSGTQSSPYLLTTGYQWGAALETLGKDVLRGTSITRESTIWSRKAALPEESGLPVEVGEPARR